MRTGQCMCGKVKYEAETEDRVSVCYCKMCQRWASGMFMGVPTNGFKVTEGADHLSIVKSSEWAERAFCSTCGSNIYYHAPEHGHPSVAFGSLDDTSGLRPRIQFFYDRKPDGISLNADTKTLTEAECMAFFASSD